MGQLKQVTMLGLFKDFGKKATDLNKKGFVADIKEGQKATFKSSTDGVKFEGTVQAGKAEAKLDFKDADMAINNKIDKDAKYSVENTFFNVMDGWNAKMKMETPKSACEGGAFFESLCLGADYATADINSSSELKVNFNIDNTCDKAFETTGWHVSTSNAFKADKDLSVGFNLLGCSFDNSKVKINGIKLGSTYTCGDMQLTAAVNGSYADDKFQAGELTSKLFQKVNNSTSIASEFSFGRSCNDRENDQVNLDATNAVSLKLGASHVLSDSATFKSKFTLSNGVSTDFSWVQKLGGNSSLTFAQSFEAEFSKPKFSIAYTLDA